MSLPGPRMAVAALDHVRFSYDGGASWALDGVDLRVAGGERVCVVGANGSGKSTLARILAGLAAPDSGSVTLLGEHVFDERSGADPDAYRRARRGIGAVFQNPEDQIVTTVVEDDVAFGPENLGVARDGIGRRIEGALRAVGMAAFRGADPTVMSGGQQQRVAIAGTLAMAPSMIVLDEPTAMLDAAARGEVMRILDALQSRGVAIVLITHHDDETAHADRVIHMADGRIMAVEDAAGSARPKPAARGKAGAAPDASGPAEPAESTRSTDSAESADPARSTTPEKPEAPTRSAAPMDPPAPTASAAPMTHAKPAASSTSADAAGTTDQGAERLPAAEAQAASAGPTEPMRADAAAVKALSDAGPAAEAQAASESGPDSPDGRTAQERPGPAVAVDHVSFSYPGAAAPVLDDVSFTVRRGETVAIMGRNGAGKSTLARLLCALERPDAGSIAICGVPTGGRRRERRELRRHIGYVMQHPERQLFADTVAQDIAYGPTNQGLPAEEVRARVDEALRLLRIEHIADRSPFALSGGQQRLAAIAGVIACHPDVLVLDEPTASLDAAATARIHELIRALRRRGVTVLIITHAPAEAKALADRVIAVGAADDAPRGNGVSATGSLDADESVPEPFDAGTPADGSRGAADGDPSDDDAVAAHPPRAGESVSGSRDAGGSADGSRGAADGARRRSPLSSLDPRVTMVTFLALMFTAFAISNAWQLGLAALLTVGVVAAGRIDPLRLLASVRLILGMLVVMGALNVFFARGGATLAELGPIAITTGGLATAALYMLRFALVILLGAVLLATTTPTALTDAVGSLLSPLRRLGVHTQEIALVLSLAMRFLPTLSREAHAIIDAQAARGGDVETGSPARRIRALTAIVVPVFAGTLRHADNLALALDARCYEEGAHRTHWREMRVRGRDAMLVAVTAAYLAMLIALA